MASFAGDRYMTRGIQADISLALQVIMWGMIDESILNKQDMDYLQVFVLEPVTVNGIALQRIEHRQEQPERKRAITLNTWEPPVSEKVFVIDSDGYVTMLLAREY